MHDKADADGSDLLLIDTGDRIEGNGLYDASEPKGEYTFDIVKQQHIDLICSGNHELYKQNASEGEFNFTVPNFKGNYLASNLDIYNPENGELVPLAPRFKKFKTKNQGIRILAFGFIFDFTGNSNNTVIHKVEDTVKEKWFKDAISDRDADLVIVFGHIAINSKEYNTIFKEIRGADWDVPIQFFGGHTHIRDYKIYDDKSVALESGRYMETIGFMSIKGLEAGGKQTYSDSKKSLSFARRYIDNNLFSFYHHSGKDNETFPTELGRRVSTQINDARKALKLDKTHGCAPRTLWVNRAPYPDKSSIFSWLEKQVLPDQLRQSSRIQSGTKALVITNTGSLRFDIFEGPFTKDTTFLVSPFTSGLRFVKDVPFKTASQVLKLLNNEGPILDTVHQQHITLTPLEQASGRRDVVAEENEFHHWELAGFDSQTRLSNDQELTPGYTTKDDGGEDGDDTLHSKISFYRVPNCIQAAVGFDLPHKNSSEVLSFDDGPEKVDLVYNEFIEEWVLLALKYLGQKYAMSDTEPYLEGKIFTDIITDWISDNWKCDDD